MTMSYLRPKTDVAGNLIGLQCQECSRYECRHAPGVECPMRSCDCDLGIANSGKRVWDLPGVSPVKVKADG